MKNTIYLNRNLRVIVKEGKTSTLSPVYLATALKNIESLGFTFSEVLMERVRTLSNDEFVTFYQTLVTDLKKMVGAHVTFKPMYANFPQSVMEMDEIEFYVNAILHYVTDGHLLPKEEAKERFPLLDSVDLKIIDLGTDEGFNDLIRNLIGANGSISASDKEDVKWALEHVEPISAVLPESIPNKENLSYAMGILLSCQKATMKDVASYFKTATDVLRLAASLSDGDVSLATPTGFRKFKRPERRFLLSLLQDIASKQGNCNGIVEDMLRYEEAWIIMGEILHPYEYKRRYPFVAEAFNIVRNQLPFKTYYTKLEMSLLNGNVTEAVKLLSKRPGEFARRLDHVIRLANKNPRLITVILSAFQEGADNVSTPVLLQVMAHFKNRNEHSDIRAFFPKGNVAKAFGLKNELAPIPQAYCTMVVELCEEVLRERFKALPSLGKTFVDERLNTYLVPFSQRSSSKSLRTLVRGSHIPLPEEGNTVRFFCWWKEGQVNGKATGRVDVDLSATFYDENWENKAYVSYSEFTAFTPHEVMEEARKEKVELPAKYSVHSGDIVAAPQGASEFIDVDMETARKSGIRYIVMSLQNYMNHAFKDLPECFGGWMIRQSSNSGEVFEPSTVQNKVDISSDTTVCLPVIIDIEERKIIWTDLSLTRDLSDVNNVETNESTMSIVGKTMTSLAKPNLYDLFRLHQEARGEITFDSEVAETVFSVEEGITPFDIEKIMAEFIA